MAKVIKSTHPIKKYADGGVVNSFIPNKAEQESVRPKGGWRDLSPDAMRKADTRAAAAGIKAKSLVGTWSEDTLKAAESHKRAVERSAKK